MTETSILDREAAHFGGLAGDWWDPDGASAMLHKLNPVRLGYIRDRVNQHWSLDEHSRRPLEGKTALDVGCGAGLLAEPLARLGAEVTAIDAAPELIDVAREHAARQGLEVDYRPAAVEDLEGHFDLIRCPTKTDVSPRGCRIDCEYKSRIGPLHSHYRSISELLLEKSLALSGR